MNTNMRKFKFGGVWMVTTVAVIAIIIAVNAVFSALSAKYALYLDLTKEQYYDISDATVDLLADVEDEIDIIFCTPLDKLSDNTFSSMIYTLAQNYAAKYDNINIKYLNWRTETESANEYMKKMANATIDDTTIIVDCPEKNSSRKLTWDSMLVYDTDGILYGFKGELQFTSAILQVTGERPLVVFTENHSEDKVGATALTSLFETAGYEVRWIDISTVAIPEEAKIVVIYNPQNDFNSAEGVNEFAKIDEFTGRCGNLMVFLSSRSRSALPELYSYLKENWYINVEYGTVKDSSEHALSIDGTNISATFTDDDSPAKSLIKHILENNQHAPTVSMEHSLALSIDEGGDNANNSLYTSHVLTTSENGEFYKDGVLDYTGEIGLMTLAARNTIVNNEERSNYILVSGSSAFASSENLETNFSKYANSDILFAAMLAMGKDKVPDAVEFKQFEDTSLNLTVAQANNWTLVFAVVIPVILMIAGVVVYFRRKHL